MPDSDTPQVSTNLTVSLVINSLPLSFTTNSTLPNATIGSNYTQILNATGGITPVRFEVIGTLPAGLTISGNRISGIPTSVGNYSINLRARDSGTPPSQITRSFLLQVTSNLSIMTVALPDGYTPVSYNHLTLPTNLRVCYTIVCVCLERKIYNNDVDIDQC